RQRLLVTEQRGGGAGPQRLPHPTGSPLARSKNLYPPPVDQRGAANRGGLAAAERPQTPALNPHPSSFPQRLWRREECRAKGCKVTKWIPINLQRKADTSPLLLHIFSLFCCFK